jgi:hypothetical protein
VLCDAGPGAHQLLSAARACATYPPQDYKAYKCVPGVAAPSGPTPAGGYFGDPQLLVLESRDPDSELRNFSPVQFDTEGVKVGGPWRQGAGRALGKPSLAGGDQGRRRRDSRLHGRHCMRG